MIYRVCASIIALSMAASAGAAVMVIGNGNARMCYQSAASGNAKGGIGYCHMALSQDPLTEDDRIATHVNRGILLLKQKNISAALRDFDAALAIKPDVAEAFVNKGIAMVNAGNDAEAIRLLSRGLALGTAKPEVAYYGRGVAYELSGKNAQAYRDYRTAADLQPRWAEPREQLKRFTVVRKGS